MPLRTLPLFAGLLLFTHGSIAQNHKPASDALPTSSRTFVVPLDPTLQFNYRTVPGGRLDTDSGVLRAAYRIQAAGPAEATPELTARAWLAEHGTRFGWTSADDLVLVDQIRTSYSTHLTFQQMFHGVPVHRRQVRVNLGPGGLPTMVLSGYATHLEDAGAFASVPAVTAEQARRTAEQMISAGPASASEPELVVYPLETPVLAWRVIAWPEGMSGEWEVMLDARSGAVLHLLDRVRRHTPEDAPRVAHAEPRTRRNRGQRRNAPEDVPRVARKVDGKGMAWIPDPITSAGVPYGGDYVDSNDGNVDVLNDERVEVSLLDIELGTDNKFRLNGPYVRIDGTIGASYTPPAEDSETDFDYLRANQHFEAVQVYYHIDTSQRYIQSLDIGRGIQNGGIRANPHGEGNLDNSSYSPFLNAVSFGDGGIDDGEDAEVILHEYAHALLEASSPGINTSEGNALHEGWSDYWAVSYTRGLMDDGVVPAHDWKKVFDWDGNETWPGRRLESSGVYPDDFDCVGGSFFCNIYADGVIWATTMMQIYDLLGKKRTDQLNLISHGYLSNPVTFVDAAEALIQADQDRFQGRHSMDIATVLVARGFIDCVPGTHDLQHTPVGMVPDAPYSLLLELTSKSCADNTLSHTVHFALNEGNWEQGEMSESGKDLFTYAVQIPASTENLAYYFEVEQPTGDLLRLPSNAPDEVFTVQVGEDTTPPAIDHAYFTHIAAVEWPVRVGANITDAVGVSSAWVEFETEDANGVRSGVENFSLTADGDRFSGIFPVPELAVGSRVHYRVWASDSAVPSNTTSLPPETALPFSIDLIEKGILASYDADEVGTLGVGGHWRRAKPPHGLQIPDSGERVWTTTADGPYTDQPSTSVLEIPGINLINFSDAYLSFWHWHDFEHDGITVPVRSPSGTAFDGGNVKFSTDDGTNWQVLPPERGYTGTLYGDNSLADEEAFAGYSYGWRRALFALPHAETVKLRIESGTNSGNTGSTAHNYAGWVLDDIRILETRPADDTPPTVHRVPKPVINVQRGEAALPLHVQVSDDTGIEAVLADYTLTRSTGADLTGILQLAMDLSDLTRFAGSFPVPATYELGDQLSYRLLVRDFDDNTVHVPASGEPPFLLVARHVARTPVHARAAFTGLWADHGHGGYAATGTGSDLVSSILFNPADLPGNATSITFRLDHALDFTDARGNVKVSTDNGSAWEVAMPLSGYNAVYGSEGSHPMQGEEVFAAQRDEVTSFDLSHHAGERVWIRIDLGTNGNLGRSESWVIRFAELENATDADTFATVPGTALHANFPNPFAEGTAVSYSLPEAMPVRLEVYNLLGQRVKVLVNQAQPAGTHTLHLSLSGLAGGVYFLHLITRDKTLSESMILAR